MRQGWTYKNFEDCLVKAAKAKQVQTSEYNSGSKYPIISQEDKMVSGYCDDDSLLYHIDNPVVIFGDHTRVLKYVDFDFVVGADGVKILIPKEFLKAKFLLYYLRWYQVPSLGYSRHYKLLKEIVLPVPPVAEQERIVAELDLLSGVIEKKKEQLKAYDQLAQSIFYDMFGDPFSNEKGWEMSCFGYIMTPAKSNKCKSHSELPILSITMHGGIVRQNERFKKVIASKDVTGYKIIKRGQLVIAFPIDEGLIYTQDIEDEGIMSPAYNVWDVDYKKVETLFLKFHLHSPSIMKYYKDKLRGTTLRRRMIPKEDLLNLPIPLPPLSLQQEFAEKIEAIERQKALVQQSIEETQTMFDYTMDKYFG